MREGGRKIREEKCWYSPHSCPVHVTLLTLVSGKECVGDEGEEAGRRWVGVEGMRS